MSCSMQYIHWTILFMSQTVHYLHYSRHGECTTFTIHVMESALSSLNYSSHEKCPTFNELFMSQSVQERHWTIHVTVSAGETLNHSCHGECPTFKYSWNLSLAARLPTSGEFSVMTYCHFLFWTKLAMARAITVSEGMVRKKVEYL